MEAARRAAPAHWPATAAPHREWIRVATQAADLPCRAGRHARRAREKNSDALSRAGRRRSARSRDAQFQPQCRVLRAARARAPRRGPPPARLCRREIPSSRHTPCPQGVAPAGNGRPAVRLWRQRLRLEWYSTALRARSTGSAKPARHVARKLPGDAARARAARERPLQRFFVRGRNLPRRAAQLSQPVLDDAEVIVLVEGIE